MYYHYTNIEALYNIVKSKNVWFSSLAFMNDEMEGFDFYSAVKEALYKKHEPEECENTLKILDSSIDNYLRFQMSFSASKLKDDISQWRAYTQLGQGVCIEFDDEFITDETVCRINCIYDDEDKWTSVCQHPCFSENVNIVEQVFKSKEGVKEYFHSIVRVLASFKNPTFRAENEVRWILSFIDQLNQGGNLKYRPHRLGLVPYHEVPVNVEKIRSIIIGPQVPSQNVETIGDFIRYNWLSSFGANRSPSYYDWDGYVEKSQVTLR